MYKLSGPWEITCTQDWAEWFKGDWNWKGFTFCHLRYENSLYLGYRDVELALLGFHLTVSYLYNPDASGRKIIDERMKELDEKFGPKEG